MPTDTLGIESRLQRMKGRETRSQSIATRFTRAEEKTLLRVASDRGMNLREWSREVLLTAARGPQPHDETALFAINALEPLLRGEKWSAEQFKEMLRYVKSNKHRVAADLMESYRSGAGE